jgi:tubulin monoglycylase TTLL15
MDNSNRKTSGSVGSVSAGSSSFDEPPMYALLDNDDVLMSKVKYMFESAGYTQVHPWQDHIDKWIVLWARRDPFHKSKESAAIAPDTIRPVQLVNHFPGATFTVKADLVKFYPFDFIPAAFLYPMEAAKWKDYVRDTPGADSYIWVRKNTDHRGVVVTDHKEARHFIKENPKAEIFVQRFVNPPHLIEGHKWDIGVYVLITSLEPLRIYYFHDMLLRFCKDPFPATLTAAIVDTYVIAGDYMSPWDFHKFQKYRGTSKNVKQWMDRYFTQMGPELGWTRHLERHTTSAIRQVVLHDMDDLLKGVRKWPGGQSHFFELFRFDFVFDDKLNPFLMEVNMSPNLSPSAHGHLSTMFGNILTDLAEITGITLGRKRAQTRIDEAYEADHAGNWIRIDA